MYASTGNQNLVSAYLAALDMVKVGELWPSPNTGQGLAHYYYFFDRLGS